MGSSLCWPSSIAEEVFLCCLHHLLESGLLPALLRARWWGWAFLSPGSLIRVYLWVLVGRASMMQSLLQGSAVPLVVLLLALFLFLLLAVLFFLVIGALGLIGRTAPWMIRAQVIVACVGLVALALEVGLTEITFYALANLDVHTPGALLIPGVGVWLMVAGLLTALISGIRFRRAGRQLVGETAPAN